MEKFKNYIIGLELSDWGSYASLIGLIISVITFIFVYLIKKRLKAKVRIPELLEELNTVCSSISNFIGSNGVNDKLILYKNLVECKSLINSLSVYTDKETIAEINKLKSKIRTKNNFCFKYIFTCKKNITDFAEKDIEEVYIGINAIMSNVSQQLKNMRIE